jgi:hypothetical protein
MDLTATEPTPANPESDTPWFPEDLDSKYMISQIRSRIRRMPGGYGLQPVRSSAARQGL